ncbi:MAG: hypothetical protein ACRCUY_01295 [Thermoguttaceae bacterium]
MNRPSFQALFAFSIILVILCSFGCGPKGPDTQYISGIVTVDGSPVENALVGFTPVQPADSSNPNNVKVPLIASGTTDAQGNYRISAMQGGKIGAGTTVGEYHISITKKDIMNAPVADKNGNIIKPMVGPPKFRYIVPKQFEDAEKSGISVTVKKGRNTFDFHLKSDGSFDSSFGQ